MSNIIEIKEAERKGLQQKQKARKPYCPHNSTMLDPHTRSVECKNCGSIIDPFDYLLKIARNNDMYWNMRKEYEQEATEARKRLDDLLRRERNTKNRLQRAEEKLSIKESNQSKSA